MTDDPGIGHCDHVCFVEATSAAEFSEIRDCGHLLPVGINEAVVPFDIVAFAHAVPVRPAFVRLQLALASREPMHRRKVEFVPPAEIGEVDNFDWLAAGVAEPVPGQWGLLSLRAG
ncbi:MAG: hypothetical protein JWO04_6123 [Gammaproteobacteria bacterium]|nr:hypothetical protein [Gammaproteobacteria bacterium]